MHGGGVALRPADRGHLSYPMISGRDFLLAPAGRPTEPPQVPVVRVYPVADRTRGMAARTKHRAMCTSQKFLTAFVVVIGIFPSARLPAQDAADPPSQQSIRNIHQAHWSFQYHQRAYPLDAIPVGARTRALQQLSLIHI